VEVVWGAEGLERAATVPEADAVVVAVAGTVGLAPTIAAISAGKDIALASKEVLVAAGSIVSRMVQEKGVQLLPIDSEHSAIFQCLLGEPRSALARIWLTASGGPFRGATREELGAVTREAALAHPRWTMGPKITIDSATLMNKGLEAIEAHHLFGVGYDAIRIVVHPQSAVHSMVEFADGSVKAHLGATDMRVPIQYALSYPDRWDAPAPPADFVALGHLDFEEPDPATFRCLGLSLEAGRTGGTLPAAMNAANEVAVAAFLDGRLAFTGIDRVVGDVMETHVTQPVTSFEQLEAVDAWARDRALLVLGSA
jgi:1-deoxy-D-xylulose-5-phosphate reductoisomerase